MRRLIIVGAIGCALALHACKALQESGHDARLATPAEAEQLQAEVAAAYAHGGTVKFKGPVYFGNGNIVDADLRGFSGSYKPTEKPHVEVEHSTATGIQSSHLVLAGTILTLFVLWLVFGRRGKEK